jgi:hypothetical protein
MLIYVYIQSRSKDTVRLRDIQRAMSFSSPSSALFHLQKLESTRLITKDALGNYQVKTRIRVGLIRNFIFIKASSYQDTFSTQVSQPLSQSCTSYCSGNFSSHPLP